MNAYREIRLRPSRRELATLAATVAVGAALYGAYAQWVAHHARTAHVVWVAGAAVAVLALTPGVGRFVYVGWMGLGVTLGLVTTPLTMALVYFLVVTPLALAFRAAARDPLRRRIDRAAKTYWLPRAKRPDLRSYFRQF